MKKFYRTYLVIATHHDTGESFVYAGKRTSSIKDPRKDSYRGSGKKISDIIDSGEYDINMIWSEDHGSPESMHVAEDKLISSLIPFGPNILNERGIKPIIKSSQPTEIEQVMSIDDAIRGMAVMERCGNDRRKMCSEARKTAPWWFEPIKKDLYTLWERLGRCSDSKLAVAANKIWPALECRESSLQVIIKEFKSQGYVVGKTRV